MAYDEELADRVRDLIGDEPELSEKKMFGGLAFLLEGHMAVAVSGEGGIMVRAGAERAPDLLAAGAARQMEMRGRPMTGWLRVDAADLDDDEVLAHWIDIGVEFAQGLPPKT